MDYSRTDLWVMDVLSDWGQRLDAFKGLPAIRAEHWQRGVVPDYVSILDAIRNLWKSGLVSWIDSEGYAIAGHAVPTDEEFGSSRYIGLTCLGGQVWEKWAEPEWGLFFMDTWDDAVNPLSDELSGVIRIEAVEQVRIRQMLFLAEAYWGIRLARTEPFNIVEVPNYRSSTWKTHRVGYFCAAGYSKGDFLPNRLLNGARVWKRRGFERETCLECLC